MCPRRTVGGPPVGASSDQVLAYDGGRRASLACFIYCLVLVMMGKVSKEMSRMITGHNVLRLDRRDMNTYVTEMVRDDTTRQDATQFARPVASLVALSSFAETNKALPSSA